ncbi:hypothetical protein OESDEN_24142, partial [Oesophagostomum dentatum]
LRSKLRRTKEAAQRSEVSTSNADELCARLSQRRHMLLILACELSAEELEPKCQGVVVLFVIFPREHSLQLYKGIMERIGSENRDERLYIKEFGVHDEEEDSTTEDENDLASVFHDAMMDSATYPSLESLPAQLKDILRGWHAEASAYTQRITKEGEKYA